MKSIALIKHHPCIQLAHLYEHLFVMRAKKLLYSAGLYKGLDYWISGKTFDQGGLIKIEYEAYSDSAIAMIGEIQTLKLDHIEGTLMARALSQIIAEEPFALRVKNKQQLQDEIIQLSCEPWLTNEEVTIVNTRDVRTRNRIIYLTNEEQPMPRALRTTISLNSAFAGENQSLLPLFNIYSRWLIFTPDDIVADENGYYSGAIYGSSQDLSVAGEILVAPPLSRHVNLDALFKTTKAIMTKMRTTDTLSRFASDIRASTEESTDFSRTPDLDRILVETGVYISYDELKKQATLENLTLLSNHSSLEMRFGRKKISEQLVNR